ncbi:RNA polymerase sigma factor [Sorangium sp. So ce542]|uniref:RNA polymerase sigma factor n=1 Tax=Sorangium sp. So ce542 TaxID=3133316 RepID=UPI003F619575
MSSSETHRAITGVWKNESVKLIASLTGVVRDVGLAEELAQEALVAALTEWPASGVPERPGAWLMTTARNRALNTIRHRRVADREHDAIGQELTSHVPLEAVEAALEAGIDDDIADDVLRLVFIACHPVLPKEARVALTLRLLGGLSTDEIARAFLATEPTIAQRIVRAKRALAEARVPFEMPRAAELGQRLGSVLEVVYLIFNEGYLASAGDDVMRPALQDEALRLGNLLCDLAPGEPEALGLLALMELQASRAAARVDANGEPILLMDQDRARWDRARIDCGLAALARAEAHARVAGPYQLQAAIAACHARARSPEETDWPRIAALYGELAARHPSPVVELNRALAVSRAEGPAAGLALLDALAAQPALARYHLLPSARADLLERLGRHDEARAEFERAASLTDNARQRRRLLERAATCARAIQA